MRIPRESLPNKTGKLILNVNNKRRNRPINSVGTLNKSMRKKTKIRKTRAAKSLMRKMSDS